MGNTIITNFPIAVYGKMEKFSDTISRGRCRVFYKGRNRNGTYITDEFAQKLIDSAPYTPVKGIYEVDDYTDHGQKRSEGRIYGIVPADPHFSWEWHTDVDGKEREYACFDVLYYTALYKEAGEINGKSESMELFRDTLKGEWKIIDGKKTYVFTDGCFLGLQALGNDVEPCFEGASFYSKDHEDTESSIIALLEKYEKRTDLFQYHEQGGNEIMPSINFKVSDCQKFDFLFSLLNPNFTEAGGWTIDYMICDVYDEYAIARNCAEGIFERIYYVKDDENDSLEITNKERCYIVDVNEEEKNALQAIKGESTYVEVQAGITEKTDTIVSLETTVGDLNSKIEEMSSTIEGMNSTIEGLNGNVGELNSQISSLTETNENLTSENAEYSTKIEELENNISTLTTERDEARSNYENASARIVEVENSYSELNNTLANITVERDALITYKKGIEDDAKKAVISNYVDSLSDEVIESYMNNIDNYTIEELDMKLTYEQKKANPNLFSKTPAPAPNAFLPKDDEVGGINNILARFEKH